MAERPVIDNIFGSTHYYQATIQYDGTGYAGFQWQKDIPSIQHDFNLAVQKLLEGRFTTLGASRTDTGVHAMEQVVKISSQFKIDHPDFVKALNQMLPNQIRCLEFRPCRSDFHPAADPVAKEYRYFFTNVRNVDPENHKFIANIPYQLNLDDMQTCVNSLVGTHDFHNFCSAGSNVKSSIRTITQCELTQINPQDIFNHTNLFRISPNLTSCYQLRIEGNGFLKQMIRHLMSSFWMVGCGKLSTQEFSNLLNGPKKEKRLWKVAAPYGLFLHKITF